MSTRSHQGCQSGFRYSSARSDVQGLGMIESRYQQHKASGGRFLIVDAHGFESVLDGAIRFERQAMLGLPSGRDSTTQAPTGPRCIRSAATSITSGPVVQSLLSAPHPRELGQSFDRGGSQRSTMLSAKCSRRILIGHRDMTSSPPASGCTEGTSWRFTWCNDPSGVACGQP